VVNYLDYKSTAAACVAHCPRRQCTPANTGKGKAKGKGQKEQRVSERGQLRQLRELPRGAPRRADSFLVDNQEEEESRGLTQIGSTTWKVFGCSQCLRPRCRSSSTSRTWSLEDFPPTKGRVWQNFTKKHPNFAAVVRGTPKNRTTRVTGQASSSTSSRSLPWSSLAAV